MRDIYPAKSVGRMEVLSQMEEIIRAKRTADHFVVRDAVHSALGARNVCLVQL